MPAPTSVIQHFDAMRLRLASPETVISWSKGEVTKPETLNYRTQKPEKGGLFAEEIFGPTKDWECYCGKYRKIRYKGIICDKCGVEVTHSLVRRERMGHISLASPVSHIWFLRSIPSKVGTVLDLSVNDLERVVYFGAFIVTRVDEEMKQVASLQLRDEYKSKRKQIENEAAQKSEVSRGKGEDPSLQAAHLQLRDRKLKTLEDEFVATERELKELTPLRIISETAFHELSLKFGHLFDASIGAEGIRELLSRVDLKATIAALEGEVVSAPPGKRDRVVRRLKLLKSFFLNKLKPEWMVMTAIPVIPPDLRPMVALDGGRFATSDLNDLYRRVINRNNRLKRLIELNAPEVISRNEKRMLQEAVDALIDNSARRTKSVTAPTGARRQLRSLADILKGKQGRFRQNLLGKRTDYSGRSVIVVGPFLRIHECGIPKRMALELFKPFVMSEIIKRGLAHNIRSASRFVEADYPEVWDILEEITRQTHVLLNRAPTLHRLGIQAFKPILIEGKAIQIPPLVCTAFNADFDGDQMAVHVPLTEEARREAEALMRADRNILKPATGQPVATPNKDIVWGSFYLTYMKKSDEKSIKYFASAEEALLAYKLRSVGLQDKIAVRFLNLSRFPKGTKAIGETTVGRILFNEALPSEMPYVNEVVNVKKMGEIFRDILERYGMEKTAEYLDAVKELGFKYITKSGYSLGMDDFPSLGEDKRVLIEEGDARVEEVETQYREGLLTSAERHAKIIEIWTEIKERVVRVGRNSLRPGGSVHAMIESGARGSWGQLTQVIGMKGLVSNPAGEIIELPVKGSFKEGFDVLEFFISTHGTRKGLSDTALRTANAGYLTRRLVDIAQDVVVRMEDCGDTQGVEITKAESEEMGEMISARVWGRYTLDAVKAKGKMIAEKDALISEADAKAMDEAGVDRVRVRSVLSCLLPKGVCARCYGLDLGRNGPVEIGVAVGIIAAQSIGEPGTQLTMRTFHTGGVAGQDITQGLPRVEELFEARPPKRKAFMADLGGRVEIEAGEERVIEGPGGRKIFQGRLGQRIIKIYHTKLGDESHGVGEGDEIAVKDGHAVLEGATLIRRTSGEEVKSGRGGKVTIEKRRVRVTGEAEAVKEYVIPAGYQLWVKKGEVIEAGAQMTEGHLDLKQLFALRGKAAVQRYILTEIQKIYSSQGQKLNDKHIETIIKQMFSRVLIKDAGNTDLLPGEIVEKATLAEANGAVGKGAPAATEELFLGVTRVSLTTQSFLSAASFQETARVLINAAITGKVDRLEGLKENVIIGRLIPAGTGFKKA